MNNLEDLKKQYKELIDKCEELGNEIEKLESVKTERWRAEEGEIYYSTGDGYADHWNEYGGKCDKFHYKTRNYFKTEEEAENYLEKINTYYDLMDLAEELNEGEEIDWKKGEQWKHYIVYSNSDKELVGMSTCIMKNIGQIYCLNENFLKIAEEKIGEDKLIKLFKEEN